MKLKKRVFAGFFALFLVIQCFYGTDFNLLKVQPVYADDAQVEPLSTPSNVNVNVYNNSAFVVSWDYVSGAVNYEVSLDNSIYSTSANMYTFSNLSPNNPYTVKVRAINASGFSEWSTEIVKYTLLDTPTNLVTTTASSISVGLTWDAVSGATGYEIYRNSTLAGTSTTNTFVDTGVSANSRYKYKVKAFNATLNVSVFSNVCIINTPTEIPPIPNNIDALISDKSMMVTWGSIPTATSYEISFDGNVTTTTMPFSLYNDLEPNTRHVVKVRAINYNGNSDWSSEMIKYTLLTVPSNLIVKPRSSSACLTWDAVSGATGYEIYRDDILIGTCNTNTYNDNGLIAGNTYVYKVKAYSNDGNSSMLSAPCSATTVTAVAPAAPENVKVETTSKTLIISWDSVSTAEGYEVSLDGNIQNVTATSCAFSDLAPNSCHKLKVRAINTAIDGAWSEEVTKYTLLETPAIFEATTKSSISIDLAWDAVDGATSYDIERNGELFSGITTTKNSFNNLTPNTRYEFRIRAIGDSNESNWSNKISAMTKLDTPTKINKIIKATSIYLSWDEVKDATGYDIEVDGVIEDNTSKLFYNHSNLTIGTEHKYRIRAKTAENYGEWSEEIVAIAKPAAPQNLETMPLANDIILTWESIEGASSYDVCIDNTIIENVSNTYYKHLNLQSAQTHTYKVRARFLSVEGDWSSEISESTPALNAVVCKVSTNKDKLFNISVNTSNKQYHEQKIFTITYNTTEVELVDLCTLTPEKELIAGDITAANLVITKSVSGEIVFSLKNPHLLDEDVTGIINVIQFKSKIDGKTSINIQLN